MRRTLNLKDFDALNVSNAIEIEFRQSDTYAVRIIGNAPLVDKRTFTLVVTRARQSRIYMMQVVGNEYQGKTYVASMHVMVIVKNKQ